jgi:hypothetical protein
VIASGSATAYRGHEGDAQDARCKQPPIPRRYSRLHWPTIALAPPAEGKSV